MQQADPSKASSHATTSVDATAVNIVCRPGAAACVQRSSSRWAIGNQAMLSKISIRTKITSLVAMLLIALSGLGAVSLLRLSSINANTTEITTNWLPTVTLLGEMRTDVLYYRMRIRDHLLETNNDAMAKLEKQIATIDEKIKTEQKAYEALISSPEERQIYQDWVELWGKYKAAAPKLLDV
ncbi:MAG: MCP four helix bundle domain-containing protein, partial [Pseudomonadota bacterium]